MRSVLEEVMTRVPMDHSTTAVKVYLAECILKAAAQGHTSYNELFAAAVGGYGHSRLREYVLGGATRGILASMTLPTLMSN
jgi:nucleotide-binding universal stress UspA family protein